MGIIKTKLDRANLTVLGHFNPAILRQEFLASNFDWALGDPVSFSPANVVVVSEIVYPNLRWFMDLSRMVVEDTQMKSWADFRSPSLAVEYLNKLEYTPLVAAGFNLHAEFELSDLEVPWKNLGSAVTVRRIVKDAKGTGGEFSSRFSISGEETIPVECTLAYTDSHNAQVRLRISRRPLGNVVEAHFNWELRGLDDDRQRIRFVEQIRHEVAQDFMSVMETVCEEVE